MPVFTPHSDKQEQAIFSDKRITICSTGIQWGKTTVGALRTKMFVHTHNGPDCNHIITAPDYKIMQQATIPEFLKVMDGMGVFNKVEAVFVCTSGAHIYCRTATNPDSIVGITNVYSIWGDEAGKYPLYFWQNILGRSRFKKCPITLTTSLYSYNWVAKDLVEPALNGKREDIHVCQAESKENPYFPEEEYEAAKATMSPSLFAMMYGGRPAKKEGLVYDCFNDRVHSVEPSRLPPSAKLYAGIDWGFTQPFACIVVALLPDKQYIIVNEHYQTKMTINDITDYLTSLRRIWNIERFFAGPDQPGSIKELNRAGIPCVGANNDVKTGIHIVYDLFKSNRLTLFKDQCKNLIDEIEGYHWPEPKFSKPDQDERDANPVKQNDHALDALRYCMISIYRKSEHKLTPRYLENTIERGNESLQQKLNRLKSRNLKNRHEKWS